MREPVVILGREIGTFNGWEEIEPCILLFLDFAPNSDLEKHTKPGDLVVDFDKGIFTQEFVGEQITVDIISVLKDMPRTENI